MEGKIAEIYTWWMGEREQRRVRQTSGLAALSTRLH